METGEVLGLQFPDAVREIVREYLTDILVVTVDRREIVVQDRQQLVDLDGRILTFGVEGSLTVGIIGHLQVITGMLFPEEIETERLRLRRLCHETVDVFEYYRLCSHHEPAIGEVTEYLPWNPHETVKETSDYLDELEAKWEDGTRAEYFIRPKEGEPGAGEIVGSGGLLIDWETQTGKPAIWLRKPFWGNEYASERADAMLELAFERLGLDLIAIPVQDGNDRSRTAVEKYISSYGGQYDGIVRNSTVRPDGAIIDHHRYTVTKKQYRES